MPRQPNPRLFHTCEAFEAAYVEWAASGLPAPTRYDSAEMEARKLRTIYVVSVEAAEAARDIYMSMLEDAEEDYERGVGAAWV